MTRLNLLLVVREEIVCLIILLFILLYSRLYKMGKDQGNFLRICSFAIGHIVFDLITVLTVNHLDSWPPVLNWVCHIVFYLFALLFSYEFLCYTVSLCFSRRALHTVRLVGLAPLGLYLLLVPFLPMEYLAGNGTNYSFGVAAIVGYGVAMLFFLASILLVLHHRKLLDRYVINALLPMLASAVVLEIAQIAIPELLFTGGAVTIISVGFFFSLENPVAALRHKVLIDAMTGVKSRHSYDAELTQMDRMFETGTQFGMVFCDINDLKAVNDTRGHQEGDAYIANIAQILMGSLKSAETIYRMGGDEFLAVYQDQRLEVIRREVAAAEAACEEQGRIHDYPLSMAIGYALSDASYTSLRDVLRTADYRMYSDKAKIKLQRAYLMGSSDQVNITGLTDRIFDAFASTDPNRFLFVTNMSTNVTRWSHSAVAYFGLGSEFVPDCISRWLERVHPDDRDVFFEDINAVFTGRQQHHELEYRLLNGSGDYVTCACSGTMLRGKNGEADLFAGTMFVRSSEESIDHITDLRNGFEMMSYFSYLLRTHTPAAIIKMSIVNLNRINMLYGYTCGNDVLKQFALAAYNALGGEGSLFRSDGTKFVVCMPNLTRDGIREVYRRIQLAAEQRIRLDALTPPLQLAAGAFMLTPDFDGSSSVLRSNLIYAHTRSKYDEHGRLVFYDDRVAGEGSESQNQLLLSIHQDAIAEHTGFYMVYQPIVNAQSGRIIGAEALLRWADNTFGTVNPDRFIPWLEGDPCFFSLGNWILRSAMQDAMRILPYQPDFKLNVNIAMPQLEHENFRGAVLSILEETGFPPTQLCLELTERCRELNMDYLKGEIEFYRSHGIHIALDDLGTGFSSFGLLLSLDVDEIKLDRAFVKEIQTQRVNQILTRMLIEASSSMGYATCLEGVEDQALCRYLGSYGATYYQGYYCAEPKRVAEFILHMEQWNAVYGA